LYEKKGAIAYVTLNRPKVLNALNQGTWENLRTAFEDARDDAAVRGVILAGAGDKAFAAGADISELARVTAVEAEKFTSYGQAVLNLIENLGKPVIAAVNGYALGGGCETAMACTIRVASEKAKFGQPEVTLGLIPGGGGTQRLPRLVGKGRALQLILSGETIGALEAYRIGLVNEVVPAADLITRAEAILKKIFSNAPIAVKFALDAANKGTLTASPWTLKQVTRVHRAGVCVQLVGSNRGSFERTILSNGNRPRTRRCKPTRPDSALVTASPDSAGFVATGA
jgi:enoyl-CoA hydratase/carnithine racemase